MYPPAKKKPRTGSSDWAGHLLVPGFRKALWKVGIWRSKRSGFFLHLITKAAFTTFDFYPVGSPVKILVCNE